MKKHWYDYLWIASLLYLLLGFFNILFAWLGLLCFFIPLIISVVSGTKSYCNRYCRPGPAVWAAGRALRAVPQEEHPKWMKSKAFRYGFLAFFFAMFFLMLLEHLFGVRRCGIWGRRSPCCGPFKLPWNWAFHHGTLFPIPAWRSSPSASTASCSHPQSWGLMITMLFKPTQKRCVYCPMGTMTQLICQNKEQPHMTVPHHAAQSCSCRSLSSSRSRTMPRESRTMPSL